MTDWRKELQDEIEQVSMRIYNNAEKIADQPDFMTGEFKIIINIESGCIPTYTVKHTHF